jgi:hypothetical protein
MSGCGAEHRCGDGRSGACTQVRGHVTRHLCGACLAFFDEEQREPAAAAPASPGSHPLLRVFTQLFDAARAPRAVRGERDAARDGIYGIWRVSVNTPYGLLSTELLLKRDKKFSQLATMNGLLTYDEGDIKVTDTFIHFTVTDHQPKKYNDEDVKWLESFGYFYRVIDHDTMEFEDRVAREKWIVRRA